MTAKQYLSQGYRLNELMKSHQEELAQLRSMIGSVSAVSYNKAGGGAARWNGDTAEQNLLMNCLELEARIQEDIGNMVDLMREIHDTIETVRDQDQRLVLRFRYILFLNWEDTAVRMNYSCPQVRRLHRAALQSVTIPEKRPTLKDDQK